MQLFEALNQDFPTLEDAVKAVETNESGSIVKFNRYPNLHGGYSDQSCTMWVYDDSTWYRISIFDGCGYRYDAGIRPV